VGRPQLASGVGHHKNPVAQVRGAKGSRRNTVPLRVVPARGQVPENSSDSPVIKQTWRVLHEHEAGSNLANQSDNFTPEAGAGPVNADLWTGAGHVLARKPACDAINVESGKGFTGYGPHILKPRHIGPMLRQHAPAKRVNLDLCHARHSGTLQAEI
jgi:hypothetical protein